MNIAFIFGRTPALAQKETVSTATILPVPWSSSMLRQNVMQLKLEGEVDGEVLAALQRRLGGTQRIVVLTGKYRSAELQEALSAALVSFAEAGGRNFGISLFGNGLGIGQIGFGLKKQLKQQGSALRYVVPKEGSALSTAQVAGNRLTGPNGLELVLIEEPGAYWLGKTVTVQDIAAYGKRDFGIPAPDPVSGMLPPKLAQSLVNLATAGAPVGELAVYDPFCGNGRVVSEAWLMGYTAFGSDIIEQKVAASLKNLQWLAEQEGRPVGDSTCWLQDATSKEAPSVLQTHLAGKKVCVVGEPYLGKPLRQPLPANQVAAWSKELEELYLGFLNSWANQQKMVSRMVIIFPKVKTEKGWYSLYQQIVDKAHQIGYSSSILATFERPDALVCREIVELRYHS